MSGLAAQVAVAKQFGHARTFANVYCSEVAACAQSIPLLNGAAAKLGLKYTDLAVSSTAVSYTAQCLELKQKKIDFVQLDFTISSSPSRTARQPRPTA